MVVATILKPGTLIQSPDNIFNVVSYEGGLYDLESKGKNFLIDEDAVTHLLEERVWVVSNG